MNLSFFTSNYVFHNSNTAIRSRYDVENDFTVEYKWERPIIIEEIDVEFFVRPILGDYFSAMLSMTRRYWYIGSCFSYRNVRLFALPE